jgi:hypothetical protein
MPAALLPVVFAPVSTRPRKGGRMTRRSLVAMLVAFLSAALLGGPLQAQGARRRRPNDNSDQYPLTLKLNKKSYKVGEPIRFTLSIGNLTVDPVAVWMSGFWANHKVELIDEDDNAVPQTELGKSAARTFDPAGSRRDKNTRIVIAPSQSFQEPIDIDLTKFFKITPGKYRLRVIYEDGQGGATIRTTSNVVSFAVK